MRSRPTPPNSLHTRVTEEDLLYRLHRQARQEIIPARNADEGDQLRRIHEEAVAAQQMAEVEKKLYEYDALSDDEKPAFFPRIFFEALLVPPYEPTEERVEGAKSQPMVYFVGPHSLTPERA